MVTGCGCALARDASNRWLGEVQDIVERGVKAFLGTVEIQGRQAAIIAADRRLQLRCIASLNELEGARDGDWVIAQYRAPRHRHLDAGGEGGAAP